MDFEENAPAYATRASNADNKVQRATRRTIKARMESEVKENYENYTIRLMLLATQYTIAAHDQSRESSRTMHLLDIDKLIMWICECSAA